MTDSLCVGLVSSGSGSRGGGEIYLRFLAEGLSSAGHHVKALVPDLPRMDELAQELSPWAQVVRFPYKSTYDRRFRSLGAFCDINHQRHLKGVLKQLDVDVLHLNQQVAEDGLDLVIAASGSGLPWVSTIHVGHSAQALGAQLGRLRDIAAKRILNRHAKTIIGVSAASQDQLQRRFTAQATTVLNGVPVPEDGQLASARQVARRDWGAGEQDICIGTVGRIESQKDPGAFLRYLGRLTDDHANLKGIWIGDGSLRAELEQQKSDAPHLSLSVDGWRRDAAERIAGLDVFIMPSRFEGLPLALLEAMHAGKPIVANAVDGIAEVVTHGETGFLCQSPGEWHESLSKLMSDSVLREKMGKAAKATARSRLSVVAMAEQTLATYRGALAK